MFMDKTTEMVAHMIGLFQTVLEEERMRDTYQKFKALKAKEPNTDPLAAQGIKFKASYTLEGFAPSVKYADKAPPVLQGEAMISQPVQPGHASAGVPMGAGPVADPVFKGPLWPAPPPPVILLGPPSSVATYTVQSAYLSDNDVLNLGPGPAPSMDVARVLEGQQQLETIAKAMLSPVSAEMIQPGETALQDAIDLHDQVGAVEATPLSGVSTTIIHGAEVVGVTVNGARPDEMPALEDLKPAYRLTEEDKQKAEEEEQDGHVFPGPFDGMLDGQDDIGGDDLDGHEVVTGANSLINEVAIASAWLDASVISVMGDVVNLDVVAQVNVLVDRDITPLTDAPGSTAMNAAAISFTSTAPDAALNASLGLPGNWAVSVLEGDVVQVNQVCQYSFVTDADCGQISFENEGTYIAMGDNTVLNLTSLSELGYGYDLILIGGNMISVNWITQVNVMLDNDDLSFAGAAPGSLSGSDNLLFNGATIDSTGVDSYTAMSGDLARATRNIGEGDLSFDKSVAHDSVFEGAEILRVLYIEGDLTTINWIGQTNVLGDSDQVHLAMEGMEAATGATATVTAGSNMTVNAARITEFGVDSTIAVGGDVYDDALIYQAELIDTDADPTGVQMPALASEAVVFLADDMLLTPDEAAADAPIMATAPEASSPDVMQTMLA